MTHPVPVTEFAVTEVEGVNCWKQIGIEGDKSCPQLPLHSHCRNCPAFSLAAAALLDRELPVETATGVAGNYGGEGIAKDAKTESAMIFRLGGEWFGLPTAAVDEVIGIRPIHSLPHRRNSGLQGLVNVRGELVICLSIAELLIGAARSASAQGRLVVVRHPGGRLALPVDEVLHIQHYSRGELQTVPATIARSPSSFTRALLPCAGKLAGILDEVSLFAALDRGLT